MMAEKQLVPKQLTASHAAKLQGNLLSWYRANKRDLPWRGADAYGVWVSEIMLQQTQVMTVIPYYIRFMARFPDVAALASAPLDDVLQHWAGLGYYARARNLHRAAGIVMEHHAGRVPSSMVEILKLPGIGTYTAGAILSIAYGARFPAIDANVVRVLCRVLGICRDPKSHSVQQQIRCAAELLVSEDRPGDLNQALMEIGALVCEPADPHCDRCPLLFCCTAGNSSNPTEFPEYGAIGAITNLVHSCVVVQNMVGAFLIIQRPPHGLWGGLWEFPRVVCNPGEPPADAAARAALEIAGIEIGEVSKLTTVKHSVTRYRITLHAFKATAANTEDRSYKSYKSSQTDANDCSLKWVALDRLCDYAFSSPQSLVRSSMLG
jgi:A/G-specific adenine glycosylase